MSVEKRHLLKSAFNYTQAGQWDRALDEYRKVIEAFPDDPNIHSMVADILAKRHDHAGAAREHVEAARLHKALGSDEKELGSLTRALRLQAGHTQAALALTQNLKRGIDQGREALAAEKIDQAEAVAQRLIDAEPGYLEANRLMDDVKAARMAMQARQAMEEENQPQESGAGDAAAEVLSRLDGAVQGYLAAEDYDNAIETLMVMLKLDPSRASLQAQLADARAKVASKQAAQAKWQAMQMAQTRELEAAKEAERAKAEEALWQRQEEQLRKRLEHERRLAEDAVRQEQAIFEQAVKELKAKKEKEVPPAPTPPPPPVLAPPKPPEPPAPPVQAKAAPLAVVEPAPAVVAKPVAPAPQPGPEAAAAHAQAQADIAAMEQQRWLLEREKAEFERRILEREKADLERKLLDQKAASLKELEERLEKEKRASLQEMEARLDKERADQRREMDEERARIKIQETDLQSQLKALMHAEMERVQAQVREQTLREVEERLSQERKAREALEAIVPQVKAPPPSQDAVAEMQAQEEKRKQELVEEALKRRQVRQTGETDARASVMKNSKRISDVLHAATTRHIVDDVDAMLDTARRYLRQDLLLDALRLCQKIAEKDPENDKVKALLQEIYLKKGM